MTRYSGETFNDHDVIDDTQKMYVCHFRIFDLEQPSEPIIKFEGHTGGIKQVCLSFPSDLSSPHPPPLGDVHTRQQGPGELQR